MSAGKEPAFEWGKIPAFQLVEASVPVAFQMRFWYHWTNKEKREI
jgi:hypothetical protein